MKCKLFVLICVIYSLNFKSQTWCPTGAEWNYTYTQPYPQMNGKLKLKYSNDTIINTITYKKITSYFFGYHVAYIINPVVINMGIFYTYENNMVVYINTDTLFNFGANIGDKWLRVNHNPSFCNAPRRLVSVIDTGHVVINNITLKKLVLQYYYKDWESTSPVSPSGTYNDTVIEKIGSINFHLIPHRCETQSFMLHISGEGYKGTFRCYSDSNFTTYHKPGTLPCDFTTKIETVDPEKTQLSIYPNPTNGILNIELDNNNTAPLVINIINPLGQIIMHCKAENQLDISHLKNGIYFLQILSKDYLIKTSKIIKD